MGFGTDSLSIDQRQEMLQIFESGYYLLTGHPVPIKFVATLHTDSDYETIEVERGRKPGTSNGLCCITTETKMEMPINAERSMSRVLGTMGHEAGHGRHRLLTVPESYAGISQTIREAVGITFGAAMVRTIGEYTGIEHINMETEYPTATVFESFWKRWGSNLDNSKKPHDRARVLLWISILKDPSLVHLKYETESAGYLSAQSLLLLADHFGNMTEEQSNVYINKYLTPENMAAVKDFAKIKISSRTTTNLLDSLINSNWEAWHVP